MKEGKLLSTILDYGEELIVNGEEMWRVENSIASLCDAYAFKRYELWVISSCIQATVETADGRIYTQIKHVPPRHVNIEKLCRLKRMESEVLRRMPGVATFRDLLDEALDVPSSGFAAKCIGYMLASCGFTVYYGGDLLDVISTAFIAAALALLSSTLSRKESSPLVYNSIASFIMETLIACIVITGVNLDPEPVASSLLLLLVSGLGVTSGIKDLMHSNTISGLNDIGHSLIGASGIAAGMLFALFLFKSQLDQMIAPMGSVSSYTVRIASCVVGCIGFAVMSDARGKTLLYSALGAVITSATNLFVLSLAGGNYFVSTLTAACFAAFFANAISHIASIPASALLITCIFPLIPGGNIYYAVYAGSMYLPDMFRQQLRIALLTCVAIALGYIIIEVLYRATRGIIKKSA